MFLTKPVDGSKESRPASSKLMMEGGRFADDQFYGHPQVAGGYFGMFQGLDE